MLTDGETRVPPSYYNRSTWDPVRYNDAIRYVWQLFGLPTDNPGYVQT